MSARLVTVLLLTTVPWSLPLDAQPRPNAGLGPGDVIRAVVDALQNHNAPSPNAGIFTVYQFASPANRANTGPYGTFLRLVKNPIFAPLLAPHPTEYGPLSVSGNRAAQEVNVRKVDGRITTFRFAVSRQTYQQTQGRCSGCWMVDQVSPVTVGR